MHWLMRLLFRQRRLVKPSPAPAKPFVWYSVEGCVRHATVYMVVDREGRSRSRYTEYLN